MSGGMGGPVQLHHCRLQIWQVLSGAVRSGSAARLEYSVERTNIVIPTNIQTVPIVNPQRYDQMKPSMVKRRRPNNDRPKPVRIILNS